MNKLVQTLFVCLKCVRHPRTAHLRRQDSQGTTNGPDACQYLLGLFREPLAELRELTRLCGAPRRAAEQYNAGSPMVVGARCGQHPCRHGFQEGDALPFAVPLQMRLRAGQSHELFSAPMAILDALNGEGEIALDYSMMTLKAVLPLWVSQAITELGARSALYESAWKALQWGTPAQFLEIVAAATAHHSEGTLFRTSGKQQVTPEHPPHEGEDISGEHEEADEHEDDDDEALLLIDDQMMNQIYRLLRQTHHLRSQRLRSQLPVPAAGRHCLAWSAS